MVKELCIPQVICREHDQSAGDDLTPAGDPLGRRSIQAHNEPLFIAHRLA